MTDKVKNFLYRCFLLPYYAFISLVQTTFVMWHFKGALICQSDAVLPITVVSGCQLVVENMFCNGCIPLTSIIDT